MDPTAAGARTLYIGHTCQSYMFGHDLIRCRCQLLDKVSGLRQAVQD
jgi:hypothetical protein